MLHRTRDLLVRQRTMLVNAIRAHLAEFGIVAAQGRRKVKELIAGLDNTEIPELAAPRFGRSLIKLTNTTNVLTRWNGESSLGISRTKPAATSPPSPASVRSRPRRLPPRSPIPLPSGTAANWQHGWGWSHGKIRAAGRSD